MSEPMSNQEYIKNSRSLCPYCHSVNIDYDNLEAYGWCISQSCWCLTCKARWSDTYMFQGYEREEEDPHG